MSIIKLIAGNRNVLTAQVETSNHVVSFYQNFFLSRRPAKREIENYLNAYELDTIDADLSSELNHDITLDEISSVVKS